MELKQLLKRLFFSLTVRCHIANGSRLGYQTDFKREETWLQEADIITRHNTTLIYQCRIS